MVILFQNILFLKEFTACSGCFGLFTKIKKGSGTSFWYIFSAWFSHKKIPYLILYLWTKFQLHTFFPSQDIKHYSLFRQLMMPSTLRFIFDHPLKQWQQGENEGRTEIQKFEYLENKKSLLDEIKSIFHSFWRAIIWWKIELADTRIVMVLKIADLISCK